MEWVDAGTQWGLMPVNWVIIGSESGLLPVQWQAIIWNNGHFLSTGPLGTSVNLESSPTELSSFKKINLTE